MKLNGVVIADPAEKNLKIRENDHYDVTRKEPGRPLGKVVTDQTVFARFPRQYPSPKNFLVQKEVTVPYDASLREEMQDDKPRMRREEKKANVEKALLEADKMLVDTDNSNAVYDPVSVNPPTFRRTDRPSLRDIRNPSSRLVDPNKLAAQFNYLYVSNNLYVGRNYQSRYYSDSTWRDLKTGRVHLFEKPFTRTFA